MDNIAAALPRFGVCSKAANNAITPAYKKAKISIEVSRASHTQKVPQVGLAQIDPVNKLKTHSIKPIGAIACATKLAVLIRHTKKITPNTANAKYRDKAMLAAGT